ncbi:MAG TPA: hypothetical protein VGS41_07140, partial [Chthonomonadales bacterium]|nr:hypothetical protein [Chthonomonadales bacterium]
CKGKDSADLFAHAVNELHKHLVGKRKVQMMMWADRLEDGAATGYGEWEASENGTAPAVDKIPRDIILCDWHYDNRTDFPSIKMLTDKGFQVQPSGWNKLDNVGEFIRCGLEQAGPRLYGYLATTWSSPEQVIREGVLPAGNSAKERSENDLHAAIDLGAKLAWQGDASDLPSTSGAPSP